MAKVNVHWVTMFTFSSRRSYGRLATMIFVLLGTPSSGGPRCLRGCLALVFPASPALRPSPSSAVSASLVVEVSGAAWPGTFVGPVPLVAGSASPLVSPLRPPRPVRPPRPRPRPRPRVELRRFVSFSPPSAPSAAGSGLRASWTETLRSKMVLPFSSLIARSASDGVETSTKA